MLRRARRLANLRPKDWLGLAQAYCYLLVAGWHLHVRRRRLDRWLMDGTPVPLPPAGPEGAPFADFAAWCVGVAARRPFRWARCLQRSLALCLWLEARGMSPALRIGVRKDGDRLGAHAWVECQGRVVNEGPMVEQEFALLRASKPSAGLPARGERGQQ